MSVSMKSIDGGSGLRAFQYCSLFLLQAYRDKCGSNHLIRSDFRSHFNVKRICQGRCVNSFNKLQLCNDQFNQFISIQHKERNLKAQCQIPAFMRCWRRCTESAGRRMPTRSMHPGYQRRWQRWHIGCAARHYRIGQKSKYLRFQDNQATHHERTRAFCSLLKAELPSTWNWPLPMAVTAGGVTPPRDPVNT